MKTRLPQLLQRWLLGFCLCCFPLFEAPAATILQITNFSHSTQGFQLAWTNVGSGTSYTVQARESLGDALWLLPQPNQPWPITASQWTDRTAVSNRMQFYRVLAVPSAERGKLLQVTTNRLYDLTTIVGTMYALGIQPQDPTYPRYPVRAIKLNYETISPWGARTKASGILCLPVGAAGMLPLATYQHGTLVRTNEAPSANGNGELNLGVIFATTGYATVVPDYLGLGESEGLQAYHHARSEATACVDMLRAARRYCANNNVALSSKLFLCGYSHGGHATMALLRELETYHTNEFAVTACAPMAGAYDLSGATTADFLSGRLMPNPYYFALLLAAYQDVYHVAPSLSDLLAPPYNATLPPLLNGNSSASTINAAMPNPPVQVLKPEYLQAFRTNAHQVLRVALRDNDLTRWCPRAPMQMFHCGGDQDVVIANSQNALASFLAQGATNVQLIIPSPTLSHGSCATPSLLQAKGWFDSLK